MTKSDTKKEDLVEAQVEQETVKATKPKWVPTFYPRTGETLLQ